MQMTFRQIKQSARPAVLVAAAFSLSFNAERSFGQNAVAAPNPWSQPGGVQVLSDPGAVDMNPYLRQMLKTVRASWDRALVQRDQASAQSQNGWATIRFTINPDGTLAAMRLEDSTHDRAIDRMAWGAVAGAEAFSPLPAAYKGPNLEVRMRFAVDQKAP
jgi:TonB family protein